MYYLKKIAKKIIRYEARLILLRYKPKIIAISGSVGKTLTKEAVYLVLSKKFFVRKNEKSFTAELGVPLTIIGYFFGINTFFQFLKNILYGLIPLVWKVKYPEWLILEIDSDKPGDLSFISSLLSIDILIMTAIGNIPSHIESFEDVYNFLLEKRKIINAVKRDGLIIYNTDDSRVSNLLRENTTKKIPCGLDGNSLVKGLEFKILYSNDKTNPVPTGMSFDVENDSNVCSITIMGSIGVQNEYACLLAIALGIQFNIPTKDICLSLNKYKALPGRMNLISGIKNTVIVDDSYNSSPIATSQALFDFNILESKGKKIVVLGDMLELGKYSTDEHRNIADLIKDTASFVICVGLRMRKLSEELLSLGFSESNIFSVDSAEEAGLELQKILEVGDLVFIKGSQSMRMERVVMEVMRHPEDKKKLLVRQEPEWLNRE